jgi:uncharacterized membrane protein
MSSTPGTSPAHGGTAGIALWLAGAAAIAWLLLVVLVPVLPPVLGAAVYAVGGVVCHQLPERSFHWAGAQLAVCGRCTGIYAGLCALAAMAPLPPRSYVRCFSDRRVARGLLAIGALPTIVTLAAEWSGVWIPSSIARALAGAVLGVAMALVVGAALSTLHYGGCLPRAAAAPRPPQTRI